MKKSIFFALLFCAFCNVSFAQEVASATVAVETDGSKTDIELLNEQHNLDEVSINDVYMMTEFGFVTEAEYKRLKREQEEANRLAAQQKAEADALAAAEAQAARKAQIEAQALKDAQASVELELIEETQSSSPILNNDFRPKSAPSVNMEDAADRTTNFSTKRIYNSVEPLPVTSTGRKPMSSNKAHRYKLRKIGKR